MAERPHDIVLLGATGFTGELTARYLAGRMPPGSSWALAGRSNTKLEELRGRLAPSGAGDATLALPSLVTVDVADAGSVQELAGSTRVLINTVGPYMRYGEPVVEACAAAGTDYVDLAGEPEFVDLMYLRYHRAAADSGARLVHSCGFDSVPYDLGALYTVSQLPDEVPIALQGFGLMVGAISGGTFHSLVEALGRIKESGRAARQRGSVERNAEDGRIAAGRRVHSRAGKPHRESIAGGWVVPAPTIDVHNVLRSARALDAYGPDFSYSHYLVTGSLVKTVGLVGGIGAVTFFAQLPQTRRLMLKLKPPGAGPSEERRAKSFFRIRFVADFRGAGSAAGFGSGLDSGDAAGFGSGLGSGDAAGAAGGREGRLVTEVTGGDPGYGETSKILAESALALAFEEGLPSAGRGGQMTPAVALGLGFVDRLVAAGIGFRVVEPADA